MTIECAPGPLIVGFDGPELTPKTRERLMHPAVGGVILFSRNYASPDQLRELTAAIKALRAPGLLITIDQEGGRVQRLKAGFTPLPPLAVLGRWYRSRPDRAGDLAYRHGRVMASEVLGHGIDLSWAPVLDLDRGSGVIGDRAMSDDPGTVAALAAFYIAGMRDAGMAACAKHFPGHGSVAADTHSQVVTDPRPVAALEDDLAPFKTLANRLQAVMMAHVCYPCRDDQPAGFSRQWVGDCLRGELGFDGLVVSDDLDMAGAGPAVPVAERLSRALDAGCDLALICDPASVEALLDEDPDVAPIDAKRLARLYGRPMASLEEQLTVPEFIAWRQSLKALT
jgi:beta-N-acetylhexosaminidase